MAKYVEFLNKSILPICPSGGRHLPIAAGTDTAAVSVHVVAARQTGATSLTYLLDLLHHRARVVRPHVPRRRALARQVVVDVRQYIAVGVEAAIAVPVRVRLADLDQVGLAHRAAAGEQHGQPDHPTTHGGGPHREWPAPDAAIVQQFGWEPNAASRAGGAAVAAAAGTGAFSRNRGRETARSARPPGAQPATWALL